MQLLKCSESFLACWNMVARALLDCYQGVAMWLLKFFFACCNVVSTVLLGGC